MNDLAAATIEAGGDLSGGEWIAYEFVDTGARVVIEQKAGGDSSTAMRVAIEKDGVRTVLNDGSSYPDALLRAFQGAGCNAVLEAPGTIRVTRPR